MSEASWRPRIGERVRMRLTGDRICDQTPQFAEEADRLGHVVRRQSTGTGRSHTHLVLLDSPPTGNAAGWRASMAARHYAADELEPIA